MFTVAVAGFLPKDSALIQLIDSQMACIQQCLNPQRKQSKLNLILSPSYASPTWGNWVSQFNCEVIGFQNCADDHWKDAFDRKIHIETSIRMPVGEMLCNQADILLAVWNEDVRELDGATWELFRLALEKRLPCVWVSSRTKHVYWQEKTVYDSFSPERISGLIRQINEADIEPTVPKQPLSPLLKAGAFLYTKYLQKYGAMRKNTDSTEDTLIRNDYQLKPGFSDAEACRRRLLAYFNRFDRAAYNATICIKPHCIGALCCHDSSHCLSRWVFTLQMSLRLCPRYR